MCFGLLLGCGVFSKLNGFKCAMCHLMIVLGHSLLLRGASIRSMMLGDWYCESRLSVYLSICLSVCLSVWLADFHPPVFSLVDTYAPKGEGSQPCPLIACLAETKTGGTAKSNPAYAPLKFRIAPSALLNFDHRPAANAQVVHVSQ